MGWNQTSCGSNPPPQFAFKLLELHPRYRGLCQEGKSYPTSFPAQAGVRLGYGVPGHPLGLWEEACQP